VETASAEFDSFAASVPSPQRLVFFLAVSRSLDVMNVVNVKHRLHCVW
jgi:hypothetical protein